MKNIHEIKPYGRGTHANAGPPGTDMRKREKMQYCCGTDYYSEWFMS